MSDAIKPQPGILDIALYVGGKASVAGVAQVIKLSSNENPFGASDKAKDAFVRAVHNLHRYPNTDHKGLRQAIADVYGLDAARVICGAGSDQLIGMIVQSYAGLGDEVIYTEHGFSMYKIYAQAHSATPVVVPEAERVVDVDAILAACTRRTKLVFIANPANPTGTMLPLEEITRLADGLPKHVILVLDGAYAEYVEGYDGGLSLVETRENVVMTRTFSKIYGLGGLRVGWSYAPQAICDVLNRVREPFNLSTVQLETAEAAMRDQDWVARSASENARMRAWLVGALAEVGVACDPSFANFILARFDSPEEAAACNDWLQNEGLLVRMVAGYGLPNCLRITIGDEPSCRQVAHAIAQFKASKA